MRRRRRGPQILPKYLYNNPVVGESKLMHKFMIHRFFLMNYTNIIEEELEITGGFISIIGRMYRYTSED